MWICLLIVMSAFAVMMQLIAVSGAIEKQFVATDPWRNGKNIVRCWSILNFERTEGIGDMSFDPYVSGWFCLNLFLLPLKTKS